MAQINCPSCGASVETPKNTGLKVAIGCLIAGGIAFVVVPILGLLAAIAIPSFVKARSTAQMNGCINNMRMIDACKEQAALKYNYDAGAAVAPAEISEFSRVSFEEIACPAGGEYTINPLGSDPDCSFHGALSTPRERPAGR